MYKIRLVLADHDSKYVDKVAEYINSIYTSRIRVVSFTRADLLREFLSSGRDKVDILLAHPNFLIDEPDLYKNVYMIVTLSDGSIIYQGKGCSINKYQPGDQLVSQLLNFYAEKNSSVSDLIKGSARTKVVSVYSPAGGVGKTSLTLGLASKLGDFGNAVLCLSFESINSMVSGLVCNGNDAMTHILISLKENVAVLPVKLEMYKTKDPSLNIDFIEPPECFLELSELKADDLRLLFQNLRQLGKYDFILVDMDAAADERAVAVFEASDSVVLVQAPDSLCYFKTQSFLNQMRITGIAEKTGFFDKLVPVVNKHYGNVDTQLSEELRTNFTIPVVQGLWHSVNGRHIFDSTREFSNSLYQLAKAVG